MSTIKLAAVLVCGVLCGACDTAGVGDPCTPEEEYRDDFAGFSMSEVSTESRSYQCKTRLCLVNHFQGRTSCPYGQSSSQAETEPACSLPGTSEPVRRAVAPQLAERRADDSVYCSCRCAGPDPNARYCECPSGFSCSPVVPKLSVGGQNQLPGSYCIKEGTAYDKSRIHPLNVCDPELSNCGE